MNVLVREQLRQSPAVVGCVDRREFAGVCDERRVVTVWHGQEPPKSWDDLISTEACWMGFLGSDEGVEAVAISSSTDLVVVELSTGRRRIHRFDTDLTAFACVDRTVVCGDSAGSCYAVSSATKACTFVGSVEPVRGYVGMALSWSAKKLRLRKEVDPAIACAAAGSSGNRLVAVRRDGCAATWNTATTESYSFELSNTVAVSLVGSIVVCAHRATLAAYTERGELLCRVSASGKLLSFFGSQGWLDSTPILLDDTTLVLGDAVSLGDDVLARTAAESSLVVLGQSGEIDRLSGRAYVNKRRSEPGDDDDILRTAVALVDEAPVAGFSRQDASSALRHLQLKEIALDELLSGGADKRDNAEALAGLAARLKAALCLATAHAEKSFVGVSSSADDDALTAACESFFDSRDDSHLRDAGLCLIDAYYAKPSLRALLRVQEYGVAPETLGSLAVECVSAADEAAKRTLRKLGVDGSYFEDEECAPVLRHALVLVRDGLRRGNSTRRPSKARTVALDLCRLLRQRPSYDDEDLCVMTALDAADAASKGAGEDWQTVAEPAFQMATGSRLVDCCLRLDDVVLARAPPFSSEPPGLASASVSICTPRRPPPGRARLASLAASDAALASTAADVLSSRGLLADLANLARVATSVRLPPSLAWINAIRSGDSADSSIFPTGTNACVDAVAELLLSEEDAVPLQTKWEIDDVCTDDAFQRAVQSDDEDLRASYAGIALARFAGNLDRPPTNLSSEACRIAERVVPDTATALKCLQLALVVSNDVADVWIASLFASDYFNKKKPTLPVRDTLLFDILKHTDSPSLPDLAQAIREHPNLTDTTPPQRITPIAQDILDQAAALRVV